MAQDRDFTKGDVRRHLVRLSGFMLMGLLSVMGANLMEAIYLGIVGTPELAAIGFAFPVVMGLQGITMGLSIGASSVVARAIGTGDWDQARRLITHCFCLVMVLIVLLGGVTYMALPYIFALLGANESIGAMATGYMQIWLTGLPFFAVAMVGSTLMRAAGDAVTPGYLMTIGSGLQVLIGPLFIFGLLNMPKLGVEGAAVAFCIARFVSLLMYSYFVIRGRLLSPSMTGFLGSCRDILHVGLPASASNLIAPFSMSVITWLLASHGATVVAGFSVASRIEAIVVMLVIALSMSIAPLVGQNWGAAEFDRVKSALRTANLFAIAWGVIAFTLLFFTGGWLVAKINDDPEVVAVAATYLMIVPVGIGMLGVMQNSTSVLNALGQPGPALMISILQMVVIGIPLALLGDYLLGYPGIFIATTSTVCLLGALSFFWLKRVINRGIESRLRLAEG